VEIILEDGNFYAKRKRGECMSEIKQFQKELDDLEAKKGKYVWDELEELITDAFEEEKISSEEFDLLMKRLMDIDCE
jgi:tetrahydromethanopterin S-methyltransferase subunit G